MFGAVPSFSLPLGRSHFWRMLYIADVVQYFQYLCEQHPELLHADEAGQRVFEVRQLEEAERDPRTGIKEKDFLVRLVLPTTELSDQTGNAVKTYEVGLLIAKYHGAREADPADWIAAMSAAERIGDEFVTRMVADSRAGNPLFFGRADMVGGLGVTSEFLMQVGDTSYSGVLLIFRMSTFRCLDPDDTDWVDDALTGYFPQKLREFPNDEAALAAGLQPGQYYTFSEDSDVGQYGVVKKITLTS